MQQDYGIEVTKEWLERTTSRRFLVLISMFTKDTAIGQKIIGDQLGKNNKKDKNHCSLDFTPSKSGVENLRTWAKGFKKK